MKAKLEGLLRQFKACPLDPIENDIMPTSLGTEPLVDEVLKFGEVSGG